MLVEIENLRIFFRSRAETFEAVRGVSFSVGKKKFAIVGKSGSGKSLTARSLMQLPRSALTRCGLTALTCAATARKRCGRSAAGASALFFRTGNIYLTR